MTRTPAARRPGLGLLEVIVAMFVMALGMISLLTLFPLGAIQMGQALRDARAAETAMQADTAMRLWWQREVVERPGVEDPAFYVMDNPDDPWQGFTAHNTAPNFAITPQGAVAVNPTDTVNSFPVYIDPLGWQARSGLDKPWLAGPPGVPVSVPPLRIPRRTVRSLYLGNPVSPPLAPTFRGTTMMDDITFSEAGVPDTTASGSPLAPPVVRQGRYNWAAVIQRPVNVNRNVADLKILVFDGRPPGTAQVNAEVVLAATTVPTGVATQPPTQIVVPVNAANPPPIRRGGWIMDGSVDAGPNGRRLAKFYRVQGLEDQGTQFVIDLQTPMVGYTGATPVPFQLYAFKGLLEVFDRPQLAPPDYKRQLP